MALTKAKIRTELQAGGLTYREARAVTSCVVKLLTKYLKQDGVLKLPIGTLKLEKPNPKRAYKFGRIVTINTKPKVKFRRNPNV